ESKKPASFTTETNSEYVALTVVLRYLVEKVTKAVLLFSIIVTLVIQLLLLYNTNQWNIAQINQIIKSQRIKRLKFQHFLTLSKDRQWKRHSRIKAPITSAVNILEICSSVL